MVWGADAERDFTGVWIFSPERSTIGALPWAAEPVLRIEQTDSILTMASDGGSRAFSLGGQAASHTYQGQTLSTMAKWEGAALLLNSLSSHGRGFTLADRLRLSRDRNTLTIRRQFMQGTVEHESSLIYVREGATAASAPKESAPPQALRASRTSPSPPPQQPRSYTIRAGTPVLLRVTHTLSSKKAGKGDRFYFETAVPLAAEHTVVVPAGSQVAGRVLDSVRPGRAKGRAELLLQFDSITLANGVHREIRARVSSADGKPVTGDDGRISQGGDKAGDAARVGGAASTGASVGSRVPHTGAAVGAAAGAAAGLAGIFATRGPDVVLAAGSTIEIVLDRDLHFQSNEIGMR